MGPQIVTTAPAKFLEKVWRPTRAIDLKTRRIHSTNQPLSRLCQLVTDRMQIQFYRLLIQMIDHVPASTRRGICHRVARQRGPREKRHNLPIPLWHAKPNEAAGNITAQIDWL